MTTKRPVLQQPRPNVRQINYLSKTFGEFRANLLDFAKSYFPNTYADFNETSPGMMFIEMAAYLGDVLSFYIDNQFKENLLAYAEQPENIITISQFLGYKPKLVSPAAVTAELSIIVPAVLVGSDYIPNPKYLPTVGVGSVFGSADASVSTFILTEDVNFKNITEDDYNIRTRDGGNNPIDYIVRKPANLVSATEKTTTFGFSSPSRFTKVTLDDTNVIGIQNIVDSDGNVWYEVDYLAQDVIMDTVDVSDNNEPGVMPSAGLRLRRVPRRFVTRVSRDLKTELLFGSGNTNDAEINLLVDSRQVATAQYGNTITETVGNTALNNLNFLDSYAYGLAPANTTLTVRYLIGGGVASNANAETITQIRNLIITDDTTEYSPSDLNAFNSTVGSIIVRNEQPATGGGPGDTLDEIRENALAFFNAQNRVVTADDYVMRAYALPQKYGQVAKAYALRDEQLNSILSFRGDEFVQNDIRPTAVNLYTLGYNRNGKLTALNTITKENLGRYLSQYRLLTDEINILDAFIINIGVNFNIRVFRNYNIQDTLARCAGVVQEYFDVSKWTINQPIIISDLIYEMGSVEGVQTVDNVVVFNKYEFANGPEYQPHKYDITSATVNGVIYPSLDPSIFELRYPKTDIIGNAIQ
jgi:hypothetical protein